MHIYGIQCDFMHRRCWNHSNFENSWFYYVIWTSDPQNHCLLGSRDRVAVNFLNRYVIYWVVPCERARPGPSEYVWQRGLGSLEGRVTAGRSWPLFKKKRSFASKIKRCHKKVSRLPENFSQEDLAWKMPIFSHLAVKDWWWWNCKILFWESLEYDFMPFMTLARSIQICLQYIYAVLRSTPYTS